MSVQAKQVTNGLILFAEQELLPALDGWRMWAATAALALISGQVDTILAGLQENKIVTTLGLISPGGDVDTEKAFAALKAAARKHGKLPVDIPVLDISYSFSEKDIETLRGYIDQAAGMQ